MALPINVLQFAGENTSAYEKFQDYFNHYMYEVKGNKRFVGFSNEGTLAQKEKAMNEVLMAEVCRISGQPMRMEGVSLEQWCANPMLKFAVDSVISTMIDAIIPTALASIDVFAEMKYVGAGQVAEFDVEPNSLYTVTKAGYGRRSVNRTEEHGTTVTVKPINHMLTTKVSIYEILSGKKNLAEIAMKAVLSLEKEATLEAISALTTLVADSSYPTALKKAGYTPDGLLEVAGIVQSENNSNVVIVGSKRALAKVLPTPAGISIGVDGNDMRINVIKDFYGYGVIELQQVKGATDFTTVFPDDKIFIVSTGTDKIIKGVVEDVALGNRYLTADNAELSTYNKSFGFDAVTASVMGVITFA